MLQPGLPFGAQHVTVPGCLGLGGLTGPLYQLLARLSGNYLWQLYPAIQVPTDQFLLLSSTDLPFPPPPLPPRPPRHKCAAREPADVSFMALRVAGEVFQQTYL